MIVRCLKPFSTGTFAMEQYEIRDVDDTLAAKLISAGLVQEVGGGSGGGVLVVHDVEGTLDKTWQDISDAMLSGGAVIQIDETGADAVLRVYEGKGTYVVSSADDVSYSASSASGYPRAGVM